jgi:hypothetical protein
MPPKRKRHAPAPGEGLKRAKPSTNESLQWSWVGTEISDASDITHEHRLIACGLSSRLPYPFCLNKWSQKLSARKERIINTSVAQQEDNKILVVSDSERCPCDPKLCRANPNCLNYMGQELWEEESKFNSIGYR